MESTMANKLPFEILANIFLLCLPQYPLTEIQPNPKIAPILLCHICSLWRAVALAYPALWCHLFIKLAIVWDSAGDPVIWSTKAFMDDMECLRWWRKNQGPIPPFLHLDSRRGKQKQGQGPYLYTFQKLSLDEDNNSFILDYMSSAQYLDTNLFYRTLTSHANNRGSGIFCPNLHTLKTEYSLIVYRRYATVEEDEICPDEYPRIFGNLPPVPLPIPPTLRRLSLYNNDTGIVWIDRLNNWSTLTHLSLSVSCSVSEWHRISRAISALQWGHIYILLSDEDIADYVEPPKHSLPMLSYLFIYFASAYNEIMEFPVRALFTNLQFPALQDLHLSSEEYASTWWDARGSIEISIALKCTPALTRLTLGSHLPCTLPNNIMALTTTGIEVDSSWRIPPSLAHLQLHVVCSRLPHISAHIEHFIQEILHPREWLNLESRSNTIRKVTIVIEEPKDTPAPEWIQTVKRIFMSAIEKYATSVTNVAFEITSQVGPGQMTLLDQTLKEWTTS